MATSGNPSKEISQKDRYYENDVGSFESISHNLVLGGPGKKKIKIDMCDRDIMVCVTVDESTARLLHLRNVREDTVDEARTAIKELLDELKTLDDSAKRVLDRQGNIDREHAIDEVHEDVCNFIHTQAEERGLNFEWTESGYPRAMLRAIKQQIYFAFRWRKQGTWEIRCGERAA